MTLRTHNHTTMSLYNFTFNHVTEPLLVEVGSVVAEDTSTLNTT